MTKIPTEDVKLKFFEMDTSDNNVVKTKINKLYTYSIYAIQVMTPKCLKKIILFKQKKNSVYLF